MSYSPFPSRLLIPLDKYESQVRDGLPRGRAKKIQVILPPGPSNRQGSNNEAQGCRGSALWGLEKFLLDIPTQSSLALPRESLKKCLHRFVLQGPWKRRSAEQSNYAYLVFPHWNWMNILSLNSHHWGNLDFFCFGPFSSRGFTWNEKRICFNSLHHFVESFLFQAFRSKAEEIKLRLTQLTVVTLYLSAQPWKPVCDIENTIPYLKTCLPGAHFFLHQDEQKTIH